MITKKPLLFVVTLLLGTFAFAQNSYSYVNSPEGLRVRDQASLSANRISGLTHMQKVKVVETGPAVTIDGIASNWIRIELPSTSWTSKDPLTGWVFGGYLTGTRELTTSVNTGSIYEPAKKNTAPIRLDVNPSHAPVTRKDFTPATGKTMADYAVATRFGVKLFVEQNGEYIWFDNLAPYTTITVSDCSDSTFYKTIWSNTECYVAKKEVVKGAIAGFSLKETAICSSASAGSATGKKYDARQLIAITDISDSPFAKTTEGYVAKADIWTNQTDVGILQAFQWELDVYAMDDSDYTKTMMLEAMLSRSAGYRETNLFYLTRENLTRLWSFLQPLGDYADNTDHEETIHQLYTEAVEMQRYFADTAICQFQEFYRILPTCGNYLTGSLYTGLLAVTTDRYKTAFYYDRTAKALLPVQPYFASTRTLKTTPLELNFAKRAKDAKTDDEMNSWVQLITRDRTKEVLIRDLGTDRRDDICEIQKSYMLSLTAESVLHTVDRVPLRNNPGTRFHITGYLEKGATCTPSKYVSKWVRGWGESNQYYEWLYVTSGSASGWVAAEQLWSGDRQIQVAEDEDDYSEHFSLSRVEARKATCVVYSSDGSDIPVYDAKTDKDAREPVGKPAWFDNTSASPIGHIPNGTNVSSSAQVFLTITDGHESLSGSALYYVTSESVSGWIRPENIITASDDNPYQNAFDAWVEYME